MAFQLKRLRFVWVELWLVFFVLHQIVSFPNRSQGQAWPARNWSQKAEQAMEAGKFDEALAIVENAVAQAPQQYLVYLIRGGIYFRMGRIEESLKDFDRSIELEPNSRPYCWQRGISLYYLERFDEGREQFEAHRTVNPNDVENAFWHFLCVGKKDGVEAARAALLPCGYDNRPPLMEVLELLRGKIEPDAVLSAADSAVGGPNGKATAKFYGQLYVGLYYDLIGDLAQAKSFLEKCLDTNIPGYMRDVAAIHLRKLSKP